MTFFKKRIVAKKQDVQIRELTVSEAEIVGGGINPQPLPPRRITL